MPNQFTDNMPHARLPAPIRTLSGKPLWMSGLPSTQQRTMGPSLIVSIAASAG
jgi:hypothetical protein